MAENKGAAGSFNINIVFEKGRKKWIPSVWKIDQQKNSGHAFGCRPRSFNTSFVSAIMNARFAVLTGP
jgi:hypothetical protein